MTRCAIIGAGLAGLTAAYQLRQELPSAQIDVWEGSERIGGKLHTVPFDGGPVVFWLGGMTPMSFSRNWALPTRLFIPRGCVRCCMPRVHTMCCQPVV